MSRNPAGRKLSRPSKRSQANEPARPEISADIVGLTDKQERFCQEYLLDLNGTQAAIRAKYSPKTANEQAARLLANVSISERIRELMEARARRTEITADYVLEGIKDLTERCIQAVPVFDENGAETGEYRFEANAALKGYELLGKHLKLFTDKQEHQHLGKDGKPADPVFTVKIVDARTRRDEVMADSEKQCKP